MKTKISAFFRVACVLSLGIVLTGFAGCRRLPDKPEGFPPLYPCTVTVTFGGRAIEGVKVGLRPVDDDSKWQAGGNTDDKGVVKVKTSFAYDGAPEGRYVISFAKTEDRLGNTIEDMQPLSLIPLKYGPDRSEEIVEIEPKKNEFVFALDAGEEVVPPPKGAVSRRRGAAR